MRSRPRVVVAGLGLVGGSLARALSEAGYAVVGVDRRAALARARAAGVLAAAFTSLEAALEDADVLVLAAPPRASLLLLRRAARLRPSGLVMTDVTSIKRAMVAEARRLGLRRFVGGHPIAGNEGQGFAASKVDLFSGRAWVLTPEGADAGAVRAVRSLVRATGARPVAMGAEEHDRVLAFLSHLPQIAAWALSAAARGDRDHPPVVGPRGPGLSRHDTSRAQPARTLARDPEGEP